MTSTASTVGAYLRDLPPDRRVAMARLCSMIRRSARGVRESMRYGLAFYELDGPLFALESGRRHMSLYVAEKDVVLKHKEALTGVNAAKSFIKFSDLNRLPLDVVERIVRDSVAARRQRVALGLGADAGRVAEAVGHQGRRGGAACEDGQTGDRQAGSRDDRRNQRDGALDARCDGRGDRYGDGRHCYEQWQDADQGARRQEEDGGKKRGRRSRRKALRAHRKEVARKGSVAATSPVQRLRFAKNCARPRSPCRHSAMNRARATRLRPPVW